MTATGILVSWGTICASYIRFRKACHVQGVQTVPEATSAWQPALAWYGLVAVTVLGILRLESG
jgi:amino acid permease